MPEPLLGLLKLCALALLYLFFLRVLRAVWAEVNPRLVTASGAESSTRQRRGASNRGRRATKRPGRLVVLEPRERRGQTWDLGEELTVGRAAGCQITLDDSYVSQLHARLFSRDGVLYVEDLGSTNGTYLNTRKVSAAVPMRRGDKLKIGSTVMELAA